MIVRTPALVQFYLCRIRRLVNSPANNRIGKTDAHNIPRPRLLSISPENMPTNVGPPEQPISPPSASIAKSAVPPVGMDFDAMEKVPGQRIPTEKPQIPQPASDSAGMGASAIKK